MGPVLPQEIITDILAFLPVKSLIRFQCVCKHWKNLIKTPFFIAAHLHHSVQSRPCLLFEQYPSQGSPFRLFSSRIHMRLYLLDCETQIVRVQNIPVVNGWLHIAGSCDGLLCLRIDKPMSLAPSLLLWNPSLREIRHVPTTLPDFVGDYYIGFGFCPIVKDYKIVRVFSDYDRQVHLVEVYSLGMGSWKKIEVGTLLRGLSMAGEGFTVNGAIFWFGFKSTLEFAEYVLVSFDIATEVFTLIPVPVPAHPGHTYRLTEFEHRLALLSSTIIDYCTSCLIELWVLEEDTGVSSERWSWAKKYTSRPHPCILHPKAIWRNEIACIDCPPNPRDVQRTVISNFTNTELKVLFDHGNYIFNYAESLVSVAESLSVSNIYVEE